MDFILEVIMGRGQKNLPIGRAGPKFGPIFVSKARYFGPALAGQNGPDQKKTKKSFLACPKPAQRQKKGRAGPKWSPLLYTDFVTHMDKKKYFLLLKVISQSYT